MTAMMALAGCPRPGLEPPSDPVPVRLLPLTVEQSLPDHVPATSVHERGGCYFYRSEGRFVLIPTTPAPDAAGPVCP